MSEPMSGAGEAAERHESALVALVASAARIAASAEAMGLAAAAELSARRKAAAAADPDSQAADDDEVERFVAAELSAALRLSQGAARDRLALAEALALRLPQTRAALAAGRISLVHARRVQEAVTGLDDAAAAAVEAEVLPKAGSQTPGQLGARLRRAVLRAEPDGGRQRCRKAAARRGVRVHPAEDGLAVMTITARADLVQAAFERICAVAQQRRRSSARQPASATWQAERENVPETFRRAQPGLEQLRADVALDALSGCPESLSQLAGVNVDLGVVASLATVLGLSDDPGELAGYGPLPADLVRELAADASWHRWLTADPVSTDRGAGVADPVPTDRGDGVADPVPTDRGDGAAGKMSSEYCTASVDDPTGAAGVPAPREPAEAGEAVVDVGRRRYRPSAALADVIRARDGECRFPTCRRRASSCDLDHLVPFAAGGDTTAKNLLALCRQHHRLKHRAGWQLVPGAAGASGTVVWVSPTGAQYPSEPRHWPTDVPAPPSPAPAA